MGEQRKGQREKSPAVAETSGDTENEFASPACYAHEMDPAYMWASPQRRPSLLRRILTLLRRGRAA
jgi:hypothetical protein